jgi:hypothetical protein
MLLSLVITRAKEFAFLRSYYYYCFLIKMVGREDILLKHDDNIMHYLLVGSHT